MNNPYYGVFEKNGTLYTKNAVPQAHVYGEQLVEENGMEYREWKPHTSKLAAALKNGLTTFPIQASSEVLYLGAAAGTTVSHIADICTDGMLYAVEVSSKVGEQLCELAEQRNNIAPLVLDARKPKDINYFVTVVDCLYQDIAQRDQTDILIRNARHFLPQSHYALFALKARSISSSQTAATIYAQEEEKLADVFRIVERINLHPYEKEHMFYVLQMR